MTAILGLVRHADNVQRRRAGEVIFDIGSPTGTCMYVVREGQLAITVNGQTLEIVEPGGIVGEMALLDDEPRSATVVAHTDCEIVPIDRNRFLFMIAETPFFALAVMRVMAQRLRATTRRERSASS
jgi:CRP/FNR family transcriptional regulator, cyclic AMP receptor protein